MVRLTGDWIPYSPPPDFPPLPPPACFNETYLGSKVDRWMGYGIQAWATSAPSPANDGVGTQKALGAQEAIGAQEALGAQSISGNLESRAQVVALGPLGYV